MGSGIFFTVCALPFSILIIILFFGRTHIKSEETRIYSVLVLTNFLGLIIELLCTLASYLYNDFQIFSDFIYKAYLVYLVTWIGFFLSYVQTISTDLKDKKNLERIKGIFRILLIIEIIIICLTSIELVASNDFSIRYTTGSSVYFTYFISAIDVIIIIYFLLKNFKKVRDKKYLPIFLFLLIGIVAIVIQFFNPQLLLMTYMETFVSVVMYFTIENPDMKLLEEVHRSKEISDNANEEKTMFLYNMTQEIRNTTDEINENANMILDSDSLDENKDCAREIKGITSKFMNMTNEILDVSKIDASCVKVYNSKYNIKNILKEVVTKYNNICKKKNLTFRVNIDHDVPDVLYGDSIGLKEAFGIIMDNSVKYTNEGYIEFNVNTIIKNDICRLIMTIEDSGVGIKSEEIKKVKINDKSFAKANNLITLMNGTMMISSNYGMGTKVKIILDQKMEVVTNKEIDKYHEIYDNKKILVVDDSEATIKIVEKLTKGSKIILDSVYNGRDCLDRIKINNDYDMILLDEQLSTISGVEIIKKIKNIRNFDIPVILLTKDNSYEYHDEINKLGFDDYILKPIKKEDLLSKINKYAKRD